MFEISDKVVCIDDSGPRYFEAIATGYPFPVKDQIYVVRDIWKTPTNTYAIQLTGFPDFFNSFGIKMGFPAYRFRKLSDIKAENSKKSELVETNAI